MRYIVNAIKEKIEITKNKSLELLDELDKVKSHLDWNNQKQVEDYERLKRRCDKVSSRLKNLRGALVSIAHAEGNYKINTFYPERSM